MDISTGLNTLSLFSAGASIYYIVANVATTAIFFALLLVIAESIKQALPPSKRKS